LSAADVYIRQFYSFLSMSFIFIVVLRARKRLKFKDVAAVKGQYRPVNTVPCVVSETK
jgi:hypothetical protein